MNFKAKVNIALMLLSLASIATATAFALYYRGTAIDYKAQWDKAAVSLKQANDIMTNMQKRQRDVAVLDAKYTQELASAQATIDRLQRDVTAGKRRLQFKTRGSTMSLDKRAAACMANEACTRPDDSAQRDYFTLRERIEVAGKQIAGLQQYIREQCLR